MNRWIAEFELEDGDTMPEHMDLEYRGVRIDFHCKPLKQESTTKNDLGVVQDLVSTITEKISEQVTESHEEFIFETIRPYCENVVQMKISKRDLEQALLKYYGKNNLGVDCISRADARSLICEIDIKHHMFGMSRKAFKDLYNGMDELPSVTPQEKKGHWIPVFQGDEIIDYRCSCCEFGNTFGKGTVGMNYCPRCGSRNEVEE